MSPVLDPDHGTQPASEPDEGPAAPNPDADSSLLADTEAEAPAPEPSSWDRLAQRTAL